MASFSVEGLDDVIRSLEKADLFTPENAAEMVNAGAEVVKEHLGRELQASSFDIGKHAGKLTYSKRAKRGRNGDYYTSITAKGNAGSGQRLATVLFVLNYGRSQKYGQIQGGYFWTRGTKNAEDPATAAVEAVAEKLLREAGLTE